jgi:D-3-phosphoglycerate dehydrogenase / 2-oxoglutarate reductase
MKVLITTVPFGAINKIPFQLLEENDIEYIINPYNRKLKDHELCELIKDFDAIIAGTEVISRQAIKNGDKLKIISRVGVGLDGVDLIASRDHSVKVTYTPEAPAPAVAELTIGLMICLLRNIHISNNYMHNSKWHRFFGRRIAEITIGIIGAGRIGGKVLRRTKSFGTPKILVNDINVDHNLGREFKLDWVTKEEIYKNADIVSLHLPLTKKTLNMIKKKELLMMKKNAILINTSRGGIINENDLYDVMKSGHLHGAAIDVFVNEPYVGKLSNLDNCVLTSHIGSMSEDCRGRMEIEATQEIVNFYQGKSLSNPVPDYEYE